VIAKSRVGWSLSSLADFLRMNLLVYSDLWARLGQRSTPPFADDPVHERSPLRRAWTAVLRDLSA
jgi:hypothetical protein